MNIAETIYQQLGGRGFRLMTGSRDFTDTGTGLLLTIVPNQSKANRLEIKYDAGMDAYTMRFYRHTPERLNWKTGKRTKAHDTEISEHIDVYCDQLTSIFTEVTGLETRMPRFEPYTGQDK